MTRMSPVLAAVFATGCTSWFVGPTVPVDGFQLSANTWAEDQVALRRWASFHFGCSEEQLSFTALDTVFQTHARQVGVEGCGQRAVYVDEYGNFMWVRNR
jgi:hypothetical protein